MLEAAGASLEAIVKLTVFLTDIANLRDYSRIKGEFIRGAQPASTAVGVSALALPELMIEIEAIAVVYPYSPRHAGPARRRRWPVPAVSIVLRAP